MPQLWSPPKGKLEKKAVFSPYCGDETTTYHDRAFFIMSVSILFLHNDNKLHIISKNGRPQFPVSLPYTMDAQNVRPYALKRPFQKKRLPIYFLKFQINDQWYASEAPPGKREKKAVFSSYSGDETTVCTSGACKKFPSEWMLTISRLFDLYNGRSECPSICLEKAVPEETVADLFLEIPNEWPMICLSSPTGKAGEKGRIFSMFWGWNNRMHWRDL